METSDPLSFLYSHNIYGVNIMAFPLLFPHIVLLFIYIFSFYLKLYGRLYSSEAKKEGNSLNKGGSGDDIEEEIDCRKLYETST